MKKTIGSLGFAACILIALMAAASPVQAANPLKGHAGVWDFDARLSIALSNNTYRLVTYLDNKSTDTSNRCDRCPEGFASALITYELWVPDGGRIWSGRLTFRDLCNGTTDRREDVLGKVTPTHGTIEIRWNVSTPDGSHSFHQGRARYTLQ